MSAGSALLRGRQRNETLMVDACTIERKATESVTAAGEIDATYTTVYSGKCRIVVRTRERLGGSWMEVGEEARVVSRLELQIPISAPEPHEGDRVTMNSSMYDPHLGSKTFFVRDVMTKSYLTSRRITIVEVSS